MNRSIQKLGQADFAARVGRVDAFFAKNGYSRSIIRNRNERPMLWALVGFGWIYLAISIADNRAYIEESLALGALSDQAHDTIMYGLVAFLVVTGVALAVHLLRLLTRGRDFRGASGSIVAGSLGAILLTQAPAGTLQSVVNSSIGGSQIIASAGDVTDEMRSMQVQVVLFTSRTIGN